MTLTDKELQVLQGIVDSEYQDEEDPCHCPVWAWSATGNLGKSAGGVVASLVKKGFVVSDDYDGEDVLTLLPAGMDALNTSKETKKSLDS